MASGLSWAMMDKLERPAGGWAGIGFTPVPVGNMVHMGHRTTPSGSPRKAEHFLSSRCESLGLFLARTRLLSHTQQR